MEGNSKREAILLQQVDESVAFIAALCIVISFLVLDTDILESKSPF